MKVGVIGVGDLGIAHVALFASFGHSVVAYDDNAFRVSLLNKGIKRFKDERIKEIISNGKEQIKFTNNISDLTGIEIVVICIDIEEINDEYHLDTFYQTIDKVKSNFTWKTTVIIKTPLPFGTCRIIDKYFNERKDIFSVAYMPYFNLEKNQYENIFLPEKIIVGTITQVAHLNVRLLFEKFLLSGVNFYFVSYEEAEMFRIAETTLEIMCSKYITNMHCLFNEHNLNFNNLLPYIKLPNISKPFNKGNSKRIMCENNNLHFFLRNNYKFNKTLEEGNMCLAQQIVDKLPKTVSSIGIFGISDSFEDINRIIVNVIEILLKEYDGSIVIYDKLNEENLKKIIGSNKKIKYALDEKGIVKKSDIILIMSNNSAFKSLNEDFYIKYGKKDLIIYDFGEAYKNCKWESVKIIQASEGKKCVYKEVLDNEKAPQY